jgi:hypothetical protein
MRINASIYIYLVRRGDRANAPNEKIYFRQSSPLALAANVWNM